MLDQLRKPFFFLAIILLGIALLLETGSSLLVNASQANAAAQSLGTHAAGLGVRSMALLDALLILTVFLMAMPLLLPERIHGRIQGLLTFVGSLIVLLLAILALFVAIAALTLMLGLLLAPIFGTIAYLGLFGTFDATGTSIVLGLLMSLKCGFALSLIAAQQRFLENKGLVLLVATSLASVMLLTFLLGVVPGFLDSITDTIGAIVVTVLTLIWSIAFLFGSLKSIFKALV